VARLFVHSDRVELANAGELKQMLFAIAGEVGAEAAEEAMAEAGEAGEAG